METIMSQIDINSMIITALTLTLAGIIGFWCKDVPVRIWDFIKRQCTTTLSITSGHRIFYDLMAFLEENYRTKNFRSFKLTNGKWGDDDTIIIGIGYGGHFIKFDKMFLYLRLVKEDSQGIAMDKETITISKLGRNRKDFEKFFKNISINREKDGNIQMYMMKEYWRPLTPIPKRSVDTVFLNMEKKNMLFNTIDNFIQSEKWYMDNGIPYHLGILLYGSPGTGKSSLIKVVASYTDYEIYYLPVSHLSQIEESMSALPKKSILVIEDIDCEKVLHNRNTNPSKKETNTDSLSFVNFSDVLNAIDGIYSAHGRILIMTTNHIEKLDPALIRPGRVDLKIELGYVDLEVFNQFTYRFFNKTVADNITLKNEITCASLQNFVLEKKSFDEIIGYVKEEDSICTETNGPGNK